MTEEQRSTDYFEREETVLTNPTAWVITIIASLVVGVVVFNVLRIANFSLADPISTATMAITAVVSMWYQKPPLKKTVPEATENS